MNERSAMQSITPIPRALNLSISATQGGPAQPRHRSHTVPAPASRPHSPLFRACTALLTLLAGTFAPAAEPRAVAIMDNSFFVEEAYNQEPGVVQHILTVHHEVDRRSGPDAQAWHLAFTQEWPVPEQTHQLSFTLPYSFLREQGRWTDGVGDLMLNYRYQLWLSRERWTALAPRASLILPTGDPDRGLGEDTLGAQFNLPFSTVLGDAFFLHANLGLTALPDAASAGGQDLLHCHVAASAIYAVTRNLHLLVEWLGTWEEGLDSGGHRSYEWWSVLSPGIRYAWNLPREVQVVLGLAVPVGLNRAAADYGVFFYLSVEHILWRAD